MPSFALPGSPDQTILEDAGPQTVLGFASGMSPGPTNESGQVLTFNITTNANSKFTTLPSINSTTGNLTYELAPNANGDILVTVRLMDNGSTDNGGVDTSAPQTFMIHVTPVNDVPLANDDSVTINEDTSIAIDVLGNDSDADGDPLEIFVNAPLHGTASVDDNGTPADFTDDFIDYAPVANYNGTDTFTYLINDNQGGSASATVAVTIDPVNDAPTAANGLLITAEDTPAGGTLTGADIDSGSLTYSVVSQATHGNVVITNAATGAYTYTPALNYNGPDSFTFKVNDGSLNSNTATVNVTVTAVDDATVALEGSVTTSEDTPVSSTLQATEVDGDTLVFSVVTQATNGNVVITNAATGAYTYTPDLNYNGPDSFTFKVNDGTSDSNTATVNITVTAVNDAPTATDGALTTAEDTPAGGTLTGADIDSGSLTYSVVSQATHGNVVITNAATGAYTYTPDLNYNGPDSFTFKVNDGSLDSNTATVTLTVTAVNDAPTATDGSLTTAEDTPSGGTLTAADVDSGSLTYSLVSQATHGTVVIINAATGAYTYTPDLNYNGPDSFTFKVNDGSLDSNTATVNITVTAVNDAPTATDGALTTAEDTPAGGTLTGADIDSGSLTYSVVSQATHGNVVITNAATGAYTYTPDLNYNGPDSFTFKVSDGSLDSNTATVNITVTAVNDAPVATDATFSLLENSVATTVVGTVAASDVDTGDTRTFAITSGNTGGTFTINPTTGQITVANNALLNFETNPVFNLVVTVTDAGTLTDTASVTVNLTNVDEPPVLALPSTTPIYVVKRGAVIIDSAAAVDDPETLSINFTGGTLTVQVTANSHASDRVEVIDQGSATNKIDLKGSRIYFNAVEIGSINTTGAGATALKITFTSAATETAVNALLKAISFRNTSTNPSNAQRTVTFTLKDNANAVIAAATQHVDVVNTITARTIQLSGTPLAYTSGATPAVIDSTATVSGGASPGFNGAKLSVLISSGINSNNRMGIANVGGITLVGKDVLFNGNKIGRASIFNNSLSVNFTGFDATPAAVQALLRAIAFSTVSANTSLADRVLTFKLTDITGVSSAAVTKTIHVAAATT